jgi:exopolysaccharide production protein ExoY
MESTLAGRVGGQAAGPGQHPGLPAGVSLWNVPRGTVERQLSDMQAAPRGQERALPQTGLPLWKRALDLTMILALSPAVLLVGGCVALIIKCGSKGPVLFRQRRIGLRGSEFTCFKFRTMHLNAETESHQNHVRQLMQSEAPMVKLDGQADPRVIPLGGALRAAGLDELPQLLNVVRGEMSLVGPRPCTPYEFELYAPWQRRRFDATPGLTGLWQVSGKNRTTFSEMVRLDICYSQRQSLWLDLKIMILTLPALWGQCRDIRNLKRKQSASAAGLGKSVQSNRI